MKYIFDNYAVTFVFNIFMLFVYMFACQATPATRIIVETPHLMIKGVFKVETGDPMHGIREQATTYLPLM